MPSATPDAKTVRQRYPIIDTFDTQPDSPLDVSGFVVLGGDLERRRSALEMALDAAVLVYASSHRIAPEHGHHLCQRATAAPLTAHELARLRTFEATLDSGQVACAYSRTS